MRILFFGFSVTEAHGSYARLARAELERAGHEVHLCALGGIHPDMAAFLLPSLLGKGPYDHVFLDIFTSAYRDKVSREAELAWPCVFMAETCLRAGAYPTLLTLYRADADPAQDRYAQIAQALAARLGIGYIDGASISYAPEERKPLLKDVVHPTEEGSRVCLQRLYPHLLATLGRSGALPPTDRYTRAGSIGVHTIPDLPLSPPGHDRGGLFQRAGIDFRYLKVAPGQATVADLGQDCQVNGFGYLMGPTSGRLHIDTDRGQRWHIDAYDEYCYYERYHCRPVTPQRARQLSFSVDAQPLDIALKKGTPDPGPREGRLCHVYASDGPLQALIEAASPSWAGLCRG